MNKKFSVAESLTFGLKTAFDNFKLFFWITTVLGFMYLLIFSLFFILAPFASLNIVKELNSFKKVFNQHEVQNNHEESPSLDSTSQAATPLEQVDAQSMKIVSKVQTTISAVAAKIKSSFNKISRLIKWQFFIKLLLGLLVITGLWLGYTKITLELYDNETSSIRTLFSCFWYVFTGFIATLIYVAIVTVGLIFFVVPGLIAFVRFGYYRHFIVDKQAGIISSLRLSLHATKGYTWDLLGLSFAMLVVPLALLPAILFVKNGVLLASTAVYRKISR